MLNKVSCYIREQQLLQQDKLYLVALSGGADSVCLLLVLRQLGYQTEAVHCNFKLRGEESDRDEQFVIDLCRQIEVKLHLTHFDTTTYAELHHVSIEMAARQLRYRYFEQLRQDIGAEDVCVAHHQDDSVETVLMNLIRGTGINGLTGIKPRQGHIVRPLLCVGRSEIEQWLQQRQQAYVTDSSNLQADVVRNKLRLNVIPQLQEITSAAKSNILTTARRMKEASLVYNHAVASSLNRLVQTDSINIGMLLEEPSPEALLFEWLSPSGFPPAVIEDIADRLPLLRSGLQWCSATHRLTASQGRLFLRPMQDERPVMTIPEAGTYRYSDTEKLRITTAEGCQILRQPDKACLDAARVAFPLTLRPVQQGDRFRPFGMKGKKLVSDYLTDRHIPLPDKRRQLVLTDANGQLLWLVGHRPDGRYCVGPATRQTLIIEYEGR
ncbi:MAG: tRNA lysidine(34) synthetase TilS [Prevotella sp.]